jgi:hypothetical protein
VHIFVLNFGGQKVSKSKQSFVIFGTKILYEKRARKTVTSFLGPILPAQPRLLVHQALE